MFLEQLYLEDFRNWEQLSLRFAPEGVTMLKGANAQGKTNLLEAVGYVATGRSFRTSPAAAMVRVGSKRARAVVRAAGSRQGRRLSFEAEINPSGPDRLKFNGRPVARRADLGEGLVVSVFSPEDLALVKGGPEQRRSFLDGLLVGLVPRHERTIADLEAILRQRNALLKSVIGARFKSLSAEVAFTLEVWDSKLAQVGTALAEARETLLQNLAPMAKEAFEELSGSAPGPLAKLEMTYLRSWRGDLAQALAASREEDLHRGVTTLGPHRDELGIKVGGMAARTHASQGEQRSVALALRLGGHLMLSSALGSAPILLLDDVFSELDRYRCEALIRALPPGQALVTTAGELPASLEAHAWYYLERGSVSGGSAPGDPGAAALGRAG